ncbi:unnamed protein product [Rotaria sp. Silwood1]|nr:unnamed protein product [Rotaria sp. Silwood1]CAF0968121.1 unnamed protein product [Rotaria sp. Silwood1]CAF3405941.1 unnamed protein product [Rotaria sp. Silwood1]CAF4671797.1 unnamed protein product [Rotaria sp. Silwood1]
MNSNRNILRPTHNRLPLKDVSSDKIFITNKTKLCTNASLQQQENVIPITSRQILTAARSIKRHLQENDNVDNEMHISPMVTTIHKANIVVLPKQTVFEENKTREQLEQDLFVLPDYRQSIFEHLKSVEHIYAPKVNFMEYQSDINSAMRTILVDWLIEVADEYKLNDETLFLCIQYVDRFLSTVNVTRSKLQLVGTTCMYVASKYEEMYRPALDEFSFITDNTYETKHILRMEQIIMKMLNFSLSGPTCYTFIQYYLTYFKPTISTHDNDNEYKCLIMLTNYLCTLSLLQDRPFSSYRSSMIAASCLLYANRLLNNDATWTNRHVQITSYNQRDLNECISAISELYTKTFHQDETTLSILRRYLKNKKENDIYERRVKEIIHESLSKIDNEDENDEIIDLTFDDIDEENMSMEDHL